MSETKDVLAKYGYERPLDWQKGMISTHEIAEELGVSESQAGRYFKKLAKEPEFQIVSVRHPKTGRIIEALLVKKTTTKQASKKRGSE